MVLTIFLQYYIKRRNEVLIVDETAGAAEEAPVTEEKTEE